MSGLNEIIGHPVGVLYRRELLGVGSPHIWYQKRIMSASKETHREFPCSGGVYRPGRGQDGGLYIKTGLRVEPPCDSGQFSAPTILALGS